MKKLPIFITLLGFFVGSPHFIHSQAQPSVQLRTDVGPREIYIGDPIRYQITVTYTSDVSALPINLTSEIGDFEVWDYQYTNPEKLTDNKLNQIHTFILTTFSTGSLTIPALTLNFQMANQENATAKTQEVPISVKSLLEEYGDEGNLRPLKGFYNFKSYLWLWVLLGLLAIGIFGTLIWKQIKKRRKTQGIPQGPPRPPEEIIWDVIQELEDSELIKENKTKEFYSRLSVGLRQYLENRYNISALDRTSTELMADFRKRNIKPECTQLLKQFLEFGDLVKFAKLTPTEGEVDADLERVKEFVQLTTPPKPEKTKKEAVPL